jgi:WD40 repeat protein
MPSVHLWRLSDGMPLPGLDLQTTDTTYNLAFSPDGKTLATAGYLPRANGNNVADSNSAMVRLWDVTTGALVRALPVHTGFYADAVAFTRDGALLATAGYEGEAEIWRVADGTRLRGFAVSGTAHNLHFSPDDSMLIVACTDGAARIWNVSTGALILDKITVANEMADADFSPDGKQIASTGDGNFVRIWDAATGELLQTLGGHSRYISHVVWVDQNRLLSDDWGGGVILWSRDSSGTFAASNAWSTGGQALGLAVSPDKTRFVTGGAGQSQAGFVFLPL